MAAAAPAEGHSPTVVHLAWSKYKQQLTKKPLQTKVQCPHMLVSLLLLLLLECQHQACPLPYPD